MAAGPAYAETVTADLFAEDPSLPWAGGGLRSQEQSRWGVGSLFAGRFRLTATLGIGGMGIVYAAWDQQRKRCVALKLVRPGETIRGTRLARLRREGRLSGRLEHPTLVPVFASGVYDGEPYVVFEYVARARRLSEVAERLTSSAKIRLIRDVAGGLGHAHAKGVVHRDVKPENILVNADGQARLVDFGLATASDSGRITSAGSRLGTPYFMAPETILNSVRGPQVDVWGLGVTLYWLLTGVLPFEADSMVELSRRIVKAAPLPPRKLRPTLPPCVERACLKALARDPAKRFRDAREFKDALESCLARPRRKERHTGRASRSVLRVLLMGVGLLWLVAIVEASFEFGR
jgi:eukaryotic-like serine/threonine-protein kinase